MNKLDKLTQFNAVLAKNNIKNNQKVRIIEQNYLKGLINLTEVTELLTKGDK